MTKVSSIYLKHHSGLWAACVKILSSKSSIQKLAMTGERGKPIATPSACTIAHQLSGMSNSYTLAAFNERLSFDNKFIILFESRSFSQ